jgi:hypothetical protein
MLMENCASTLRGKADQTGVPSDLVVTRPLRKFIEIEPFTPQWL